MITVQILTLNNQDTIKKTLDSVSSFQISVIDIGSTDDTLKIAQNYTSDIHLQTTIDRSKLRNKITNETNTDYVLFLNPYEILTDINLTEETSKFPILNGNIVNKETRLFKKEDAKFINPVYESISPQTGRLVSNFIYTQPHSVSYLNDEIQNWKKNKPIALEPFYFEAFEYLSQGNMDKFITLSSHYLFGNDADIPPVVMTKYHMAIVHIARKNIEKALEHILSCLALHPLMAELWCLLGDVYYFLVQDYIKANQFYGNAVFFGKHRDQNDVLPIDLLKYETYPTQMMESCSQLKKSMKIISFR